MAGHQGVHHYGAANGYMHNISDDDAWRSITCGRCGEKGPAAVVARADSTLLWVRCSGCGRGAVINLDEVSPGVPFGPDIAGLPADVDAAYEEARRCMAVNAHTAAELLCRKILMHVAVDRAGAAEGATFASYVEALQSHGYITPPMNGWVDLIRTHANESTHELDPPSRKRAEGTVWFTSQLLRIVYEMDHLAQQFAPAPLPLDSDSA